MDCLIDCLSAWLEKKDAVEDKGCPSWLTLVTALEKLKEHHIAANIKAKYCNIQNIQYTASAPPHEVQVDKCDDKDKVHEVEVEAESKIVGKI